ncbi:MAG: hypothetical protein U0236_14380, partial [Nitrospira sp.]
LDQANCARIDSLTTLRKLGVGVGCRVLERQGLALQNCTVRLPGRSRSTPDQRKLDKAGAGTRWHTRFWLGHWCKSYGRYHVYLGNRWQLPLHHPHGYPTTFNSDKLA